MPIETKSARRNGARILIVEDSLTQAERLKYLLEQQWTSSAARMAFLDLFNDNGQAIDELPDVPDPAS